MHKTGQGYTITTYISKCIGYKTGISTAYWGAEDEPNICYKSALNFLLKDECKGVRISQEDFNLIAGLRRHKEGIIKYPSNKNDSKGMMETELRKATFYSTKYHALLSRYSLQKNGIFGCGITEYFSINNAYRDIFYEKSTEQYAIGMLNDNLFSFYIKLGIYLSIIFLFLAIFVLRFIPNYMNTLLLYSNKWIAKDNTKAFVFRHKWLRECIGYEISPKEQKKISIQFTNKRRTIMMKKENAQNYIYKITHLSPKELRLVDASTGEETIYIPQERNDLESQS